MDAKGTCRHAPFPPHRKQSYYTPFLKFLQVFPRFFLKSLNFILRGRAFCNNASIFCRTVPVQVRTEVLSRIRICAVRHLFWCSADNNRTATVAALRPEVDDPVRHLDDVQIVLNHDDRISGIRQALEHIHQTVHVCGVQTCGRLVQNIDGLSGAVLFNTIRT